MNCDFLNVSGVSVLKLKHAKIKMAVITDDMLLAAITETALFLDVQLDNKLKNQVLDCLKEVFAR